ncbi:LLM class flavin-dependent oxidoreductase [Pseudonocardia kunmingensis]|uniref:Alkanesulfonate monooxygenase SsuD/methylene tetrahydromethanopterin reductase-like flavin-dependent oxidoreductase (Luciferase family) n=1 Tax=Pseudonocardia kunmingensis TaxID=630975 RepID=A0A543DPZ5_9PSEU|nr:LLM class flavin-dependent oxidoreductase [Pseudonocardia kunmingensis]TQM11379.1 alkanesulfonate monooxygenase SsuD/methylene tetrahydromethanopterin reductase-like flavin-dependent oxidoreductase (luciferase family) [Pseudonocardia kunmingensis]
MRFGMPWPGADVAREAEQVGVGAFCTGDFVDHDAYTTLAEIVASTERALVGPAIAYAFARTPYAHATAMRQLHATAPGRLFLGLGSAAYRINRDWFGVPADRPVDRIAETVDVVRAWLHAENGEKIRYSGEFYAIDADVRAPVLGRLEIPVLLAAFNKRMAATAGRVADGMIGHGLFTRSWWNDVVRPAVEKGMASGERTDRPLEQGWIITAVNDTEPERAIADARRMIAFYLTVKTYDPFVTHHGWEGPVEQLRGAFRQGDTDAMAAAVTDEILTEIAVCGTTSEAKEQLARRTDALPHDVGYFAPPSFLVGRKRRAAYARASLGLLDGPVPGTPAR